MSWADSAGALISTAADLTRFWTAIGRSTLLPPAQTRQMQTTVPATGGDSASVPGSRYGLGIFFIPLSCGGGYWSHEGDVPGYNTIGAVSSNGHTTVVLSVNSNVDARYWPPNTASSTTSCATRDTSPATADRPRHHPKPQRTRLAAMQLACRSRLPRAGNGGAGYRNPSGYQPRIVVRAMDQDLDIEAANWRRPGAR
jgi:hypothetical protein